MSGTGTGVLVSVRLTSLRCLLSDGLRGEGLGIPSHLLGCHGRYGPEGLLQWLVPGWYCWLLCTSCCVPFPGWQAPGAWHSGRYGPEVHLQWHVQSWFFWCFYTSRCVARGVQENWIIWEMAFIFLQPLVSGSHLFELLPEEYRVADFPGDDSRNGFSIQHPSWFNSGYMFGISLRGLFGRITLSTGREDFRILRSILVLLTADCGVSAVAVHRCRRHLCHGAQADSHGR